MRSESAEREALERHDWLEEEYFARLDELREIFTRLGLSFNAIQLTEITHIVYTAVGVAVFR